MTKFAENFRDSARTAEARGLSSLARHRPGGGETICPRRRQFDGGMYRFAANQKSRRIYVRPRTGPQSARFWWPAVAKLQAASVHIA